jgi:hypothetical protein
MFFKEHLVLSIGIVLASVLIFVFEFVFYDTVEIFRGGAKLAEILVNLSLAYIASIIVYFVTSYLPEFRRRVGVSNGVKESALRMKFCFEWFFRNQGSGIPENTYIEQFVKQIDWNKNHPFLIRSKEGSYSLAQFSGQGNVPYIQALDSYLIGTLTREINILTKFSPSLHPSVQDSLFNLASCKAVTWFANYPASEFSTISKDSDFLSLTLVELARKARSLNNDIFSIYKNV